MKPKLKIKLKGKTPRGIDRIKKYGEWFNVVNKTKSIENWFINKPVWYISPSRIIQNHGGIGNHWMFIKNDPDYRIIEKLE